MNNRPNIIIINRMRCGQKRYTLLEMRLHIHQIKIIWKKSTQDGMRLLFGEFIKPNGRMLVKI